MDDKDKIIHDFLLNLSREPLDETKLKEVSSILFTEVYKEEYRHSYANILRTIIDIKKESKNNKEFLDVLQILDSNINEFKKTIISSSELRIMEGKGEEEERRIKKSLFKLYDHVSMDIVRMSIMIEQERNLLSIQSLEFSKTKSSLENGRIDLTEKIEDAEKRLEITKKETENLKTEFITILGIFSGIILAFASTIGFSNNLLMSLSNVPLYKSGFMAAVCGMILFNSIFGLLHMIAKMNGRNIVHPCSSFESKNIEVNDGLSCHLCKNECVLLKKINKRIPYVGYMNILFFALMFFMFIIWGITNLSFWELISLIINIMFVGYMARKLLT